MMQRLEMPDLTVVKVNKQCRTCGHQWRGHFFKQWVPGAHIAESDGKKHVLSTCDHCVDKWELEQKRRQLEGYLQAVDGALKMGPTKSKKIRYMRRKVRILESLRDTHDAGSVRWADCTDRIRKLNKTIGQLET